MGTFGSTTDRLSSSSITGYSLSVGLFLREPRPREPVTNKILFALILETPSFKGP
jgi:hypothetical protein